MFFVMKKKKQKQKQKQIQPDLLGFIFVAAIVSALWLPSCQGCKGSNPASPPTTKEVFKKAASDDAGDNNNEDTEDETEEDFAEVWRNCLLYTSPSPRD